MAFSCNGKCTLLESTRSGKNGSFKKGYKRCQICDIYLKWDGLHCPCCNVKLRLHRRGSRNVWTAGRQKELKRRPPPKNRKVPFKGECELCKVKITRVLGSGKHPKYCEKCKRIVRRRQQKECRARKNDQPSL